MPDSGSEPADSGPNAGWFAATRWSVVLAAGAEDPVRRTEALEALYRTYWPALYGFIRHQGHGIEDAQDLTQGFFSHLLSKDYWTTLSPAKGKFRSFLLASLKHFLSDQHLRNCAAKRGGGQTLLPLDSEIAERSYRQDSTCDWTPDKLFDRRWALSVMENAFGALEREYAAGGRGAQFERLKPFLSMEPGPGDYERVAAELKANAGAVAVNVHRLRQRFGERLRATVAETVATPAEAEEEMRYVLELLSR